MIRLFASLLVALGLFFSPMAMEMGGGTAMARTSMAETEGSCAGMDHPSRDDQSSDVPMSCFSACAAIPGAPAELGEQAAALAAARIVLPAQRLTGIWPEGETPPPRIASEI